MSFGRVFIAIFFLSNINDGKTEGYESEAANLLFRRLGDRAFNYNCSNFRPPIFEGPRYLEEVILIDTTWNNSSLLVKLIQNGIVRVSISKNQNSDSLDIESAEFDFESIGYAKTHKGIIVISAGSKEFSNFVNVDSSHSVVSLRGLNSRVCLIGLYYNNSNLSLFANQFETEMQYAVFSKKHKRFFCWESKGGQSGKKGSWTTVAEVKIQKDRFKVVREKKLYVSILDVWDNKYRVNQNFSEFYSDMYLWFLGK